MKPLFDENLAPSLVRALEDLYPESVHVRDAELKSSPDAVVWEYAAKMGYAIVTKDGDFYERSSLYGPPPKVIWIRTGNCSTTQIAEILRMRHVQILSFAVLEEIGFLELF